MQFSQLYSSFSLSTCIILPFLGTDTGCNIFFSLFFPLSSPLGFLPPSWAIDSPSQEPVEPAGKWGREGGKRGFDNKKHEMKTIIMSPLCKLVRIRPIKKKDYIMTHEWRENDRLVIFWNLISLSPLFSVLCFSKLNVFLLLTGLPWSEHHQYRGGSPLRQDWQLVQNWPPQMQDGTVRETIPLSG